MITSFTRTYLFSLDDVVDKKCWDELLIELNKSNVDYSSTIVGDIAIVEIKGKWMKETSL